jgi:hypothetical protein
LEKVEVDFWNKTGYDPRKVWDGFKMYDDYKVHYEIYEGALDFLNQKMIENKQPLIKSINDDYVDGDLVLIKDGPEYNVGAYNGTFMQIIRDNVSIPKSELELELDRIREENQKKIEALEGSELGTKSDREIYLEAQKIKTDNYFKQFKQQFKIDLVYTMDKLFIDVPEAKGAFDAYVTQLDSETDACASEYFDVSDAGGGS